MIKYPIKILQIFAETFEPGSDKYFHWLLDNGYPELAALSHTIKGDRKAKEWLMNNKFYHLAALDSTIDDEKSARNWLIRYNHHDLVALADAVNKDKEAYQWLEDKQLDIYVHIATKIRKYLDDQYLNYHKIIF